MTVSREVVAVSERMARLRDALDAWASALPAEALARRTGRGASVASVLDAVRSRTGPEPLLAEAGAVLDAVSLGAAVPESAPPIPQECVASAVRTTLRQLSARHPGRLVEVRVPPWGAVQVGVPGVASVHRRGTPPNVVECDPTTWLRMASGDLAWADALGAGRVLASGAHAQLGDLLPL